MNWTAGSGMSSLRLIGRLGRGLVLRDTIRRFAGGWYTSDTVLLLADPKVSWRVSINASFSLRVLLVDAHRALSLSFRACERLGRTDVLNSQGLVGRRSGAATIASEAFVVTRFDGVGWAR
jgi:hypothetical protein